MIERLLALNLIPKRVMRGYVLGYFQLRPSQSIPVAVVLPDDDSQTKLEQMSSALAWSKHKQSAWFVRLHAVDMF